MWKDFPLFPESASTISGQVDALYFFLLAVSGFFALLICFLVVFFSVKYRRRSDSDRPPHIEGSLRLEAVWTIIPFVLAMVMFTWGAAVYIANAHEPTNATDMYVVAKQWMWKIQHPQGQREINELHVPVGENVRLTMTSEDVIHSFYVPAFRLKRDVLPGRYHTLWFQATKVGAYHLFCAEYCGTRHSGMIGTVYVMEPQAYEQWLGGASSGEAPEVAGRQLFESMRCDTCHKQAPDARGPSLNGLFGKQVTLTGGAHAVANEDYIRESILKPMAKVTAGFDPIMPTYEGQLGEEQILQLIAYIKTLDGGAGSGGATPK